MGLLEDWGIRPATPQDAAGIAAAHQASILGIGPRFYPPDIVEVWGAPHDPQKYRDAMEQGEVFWVAEPLQSRFIDMLDHGKVHYLQGFSSYQLRRPDPVQPPQHHLQCLYIRPEARGMGVADALFDGVRDHAKGQGARELYIEGSLVGLKFYLRRGAREVERYDHVFKRAPHIHMPAVRLVMEM